MRVSFIRTLSFALLFFCGYAHGQQRLVKGEVVDEKGVPLPGVDVVVQGTQHGTSTDLEGKYAIDLSDKQKLEFHYVGYQSKTVTPGTSNTLNVTLVPSQKSLEEVVIVGYGERNKAELSAAISSVDVKKTLEQTNFTNVSEALSGSVSGISVSATSGQPGSATFDIIRGVGSVNASSRPLYVINGVPFTNTDPTNLPNSSPLAALDPNSIKSVSILKDASATAIYGARGANGVILITTKNGAYNQKTRFSFRSEYSLGDVAFDKFQPLNAKEWIERYAMGLVGAGEAKTLAAARKKAIKDSKWDGKTSTDWNDYTTRDKTIVSSHNLNISGGTRKMRYNLGVGLYTNKGLQLGTGFNRYSFNSSLTHRYSDKLTFGTNFNLAHVTQNSIPEDASFSNPINTRYFMPPTVPPYNQDGSYNADMGVFGTANTIAVSKLNVNRAQQLFLNGNAFAEYHFLDAFKFRSNFSGNYVRYDQNIFWNPLYGDGKAKNGYGFDVYNGHFTWGWTNTLNFKKRFGMHAFDVDLGTSITEERKRNITTEGEDFTFTDLPYLVNASKKTDAFSNLLLAHFRSYFSRLTYTLNGKYSATATLRRDGSSRFGPNEKYGNFWALSGAWNLSQEDFISDFFNDLKLRASLGKAGNAEIGDFEYLSLVSSRDATGKNNRYNQQPGVAVQNVGNPDLSWESKQEWDIGLDMTILDKRLQFVFDYYHARSYGLLLNVPLSPLTGFSSQLQNVGSLENQGFEVTLSGELIRKNDFSWNVKTVFSINNNEVTDLDSLSLTGTTLHDFKLPAVGQPLGAWYMRGWAGVDPETGGPLWYTDSTETDTTSDYGKAELYYQGNSIPRYIGGLTNTLTYRNFSLSFLLDYKGGYKVYDHWARYYDSDGAKIANFGGRKASFNDRWSLDNPNAKYPKYVNGDIRGSNKSSSRYLYNGDFIRLRTLRLAYTLPKKIVKELKLASLTFYLKGSNLWTLVFDEDLYFDPEVLNNDPQRTNYKDTPQWQGAGFYNVAQPVMRYYGMGVNLIF